MIKKMKANKSNQIFIKNCPSIISADEESARELVQIKSEEDISKKHETQQECLELVKSSAKVDKEIILESQDKRLKSNFNIDKIESDSSEREKKNQLKLETMNITAIRPKSEEKKQYFTHQSVPVASSLVNEKDIVDNDVLCRRGAGVHRHCGNKIFRMLINKYQGVYFSVSVLKKSQIASMIVSTIMYSTASPGRFLRKLDYAGQNGEEIWYDIGFKAAKDKTSQALRERNMHVHTVGTILPRNIYQQPIIDNTSLLVQSEHMAEQMSSIYNRCGGNDNLSEKRKSQRETVNEILKASSLNYKSHLILDNDKQKPLEGDSRYIVKNVNNNDVLMGRGGITNSHVGNIRYRQLVQGFQINYLKLPKMKKSSIAKTIVEMIHSRGGRFLMQIHEKKHWVEVEDIRAREKTSQALREKAPEIKRWLLDKKNRESSFNSYNSNRYDKSNRNVQRSSVFVPPSLPNGMSSQIHGSDSSDGMILNNSWQYANVGRQNFRGMEHTTFPNINYDGSSKERESKVDSNFCNFSSISRHINANDVLCGRGAGVNKHPGNLYFRNLAQENKRLYKAASRKDKGLIAMNIVSRIHSLGGRFLTSDSKEKTIHATFQWTEIEHGKAREKVSQALREKSATIVSKSNNSPNTIPGRPAQLKFAFNIPYAKDNFQRYNCNGTHAPHIN